MCLTELHCRWDSTPSLLPWSPYRTPVWHLDDELPLAEALAASPRGAGTFGPWSYLHDRFLHRGRDVTAEVRAIRHANVNG